MSKNLVVCIDGTANAPGQIDGDDVPVGQGRYVQTNVARTWEALTGQTLDLERPYGSIYKIQARKGETEQGEALYLNGVGSSGNFVSRTFQGGTGTGTSERIRDAYRFLAERWQPVDHIFGFGFSRGAFAIRSLAGFINDVGLPLKNNLLKEDELAELFGIYSNGGKGPRWTEPKAKVDFIGIWDTVGRLAFGRTVNGYHRISPQNVKVVCHALALDEQRKHFQYEPWVTSNLRQTIEQVWFMGAHSNVGGGYRDDHLSNIALFWILKRALDHGLELSLKAVSGWDREGINGRIRDSYVEFFKKPSLIGELFTALGIAKSEREVPPGHRLHQSVTDATLASWYTLRTKIPKGIKTENWGV